MNTALKFARWLQSIDVQIIGEDADLDRLYDLWAEVAEPYCNHDAAALTPTEANLCECGALVPPLPDED